MVIGFWTDCSFDFWIYLDVVEEESGISFFLVAIEIGSSFYFGFGCDFLGDLCDSEEEETSSDFVEAVSHLQQSVDRCRHRLSQKEVRTLSLMSCL